MPRHGASDARRLKLCQDLTPTECDTLLNCYIVTCRTRCRIACFPLDKTTLTLCFSVLAEQVVLILIDDAVSIEEFLEILVVDTLGMQLKVDPLIETNRRGLSARHLAEHRR